MLIALDFDETYTVDPLFWDLVISAAKHHGHSVICATMRYQCEGSDVINMLENKVDRIIFTGRIAKADFLEEVGYTPDIWIDDTPRWIHQDAS